MQFLIGFLIIVVILAVPAFRNIALLLTLLGLIGFFILTASGPKIRQLRTATKWMKFKKKLKSHDS